MSTQSFADLGVSPVVVRALAQRGVTTPFAVQEMVLPDVSAGRDVLVKSPTGSGKTLAFGIGLVERLEAEGPRPSALVLVPTRELAQQIVEELRDIAHARALSVTAVYGGAGLDRQARAAARAHVLVATPGRLEDLLARRAVRLDRLRALVLDEADRMLDMGFRPAVDRIVGLTPAARQTLFFSATLDGEAGRIAAHYTRDAARHEREAPARLRSRVEHRFRPVAAEHKLDALVGELGNAGRRTLVFVRTKHGADKLVKRLRARDHHAVAMHGNKTQGQRERALRSFGTGDVRTLVATDVAARGIDVDDITHVINFDAPADREGYVHRVGRTGRAGNGGVGITFVTPEQSPDMARIARQLDLEHAGLGTGDRPRSSSRGGRRRR